MELLEKDIWWYFKGHTLCFAKESYYKQENHPSSLAQGTQHGSML